MARSTKKNDVPITNEAKQKALKKGGNLGDLERPSTASGRRARRISAKQQGVKITLKEASNSNTSRKDGADRGSGCEEGVEDEGPPLD